MIAEYLVHAAVHLAIDLVASSSLVHKPIVSSMCLKNSCVWFRAFSSLLCLFSDSTASRKSCSID